MPPPGPRWVVADRREGKTTALATWLLGGHRVGGWPGWSRVLVVANARRAAELISGPAFADTQTRLRRLGTPGLGKLVIGVDQVQMLRGVSHEVEFALDDVDAVLARVLGPVAGRVAVLSASGRPRTPEELIEDTNPEYAANLRELRPGPDRG